MNFRFWLESQFSSTSYLLLRAFFDGQDNLFTLQDAFLDQGQDGLGKLVKTAMEFPGGKITDRSKIIEFNKIFRQEARGIKREFNPQKWRVDDATFQKYGFVATISENGTVETRNSGAQWRYNEITYLLHHPGKSAVLYKTWSMPDQIELQKLADNGVSVWPLGDYSSTDEIVSSGMPVGFGGSRITPATYNRKIAASECPQGMLWRAFFTILAKYGSPDLVKLI